MVQHIHAFPLPFSSTNVIYDNSDTETEKEEGKTESEVEAADATVEKTTKV